MQGTHLIADCHSCSGNLINLDKLREVCTKAIVDNGLSIVTEAWHKFPR
jgi:S-adenosylmethionine/arginine decarboxylase-like enzyme